MWLGSSVTATPRSIGPKSIQEMGGEMSICWNKLIAISIRGYVC